MDNNEIRENLCEMYGDYDLLFMGGYDDCIIGVMERYGMEPIVIYDKGKVIAKHIEDGMSLNEAVEFFDYNQLGAYVEERTPGFLDIILDNQ